MKLPHLIQMPDAEAVVRSILLAGLPEYGEADPTVATRIPNPRPDEFWIVKRSGGVQRTFVTDEANVIVESWATSTARAAQMAALARGLVHLASGTVVDGATVGATGELSGPGPLPDPASDQIRYRQTLTITLRGEQVDPDPISS